MRIINDSRLEYIIIFTGISDFSVISQSLDMKWFIVYNTPMRGMAETLHLKGNTPENEWIV